MRHQLRVPSCCTAVVAFAAAVTLGACSTGQMSDLVPKAPDFSNIDWNPYSKAQETIKPMTESKATPADYVNADGSCAGGSTGTVAEGQAATAVALLMTECEVVNRLGPPETINIGANDRGDRQVIMLYSRGEQPGRYRFTAGRLTLIERVAEPPAPAKPKKPAAKPRRSVS